MIFDKEFIWYKDHYVHHLTTKDKMTDIISKGLIPMIGNRSTSINDNNKAIYFFDDLSLIDAWVEELYSDRNKSELELLRFNLKRKKWFYRDSEIGDYYIKKKIEPSDIEFLKIYSSKGKLPITEENIQKNNLVWENIKSYK